MIPSGRDAGPPARRDARTAAAVAVLLVVVLAVVAVALRSASDRPTGAAPATTGRAAASTSPRTSPTTSASPFGEDPETGLRLVALTSLPRQAQETVALVDSGGPFPYAQDGATFGNYEGRLPAQRRRWYREYTVRTPGERDRGPRRIVTGDDDRDLFYTADHYATFVRVVR